MQEQTEFVHEHPRGHRPPPIEGMKPNLCGGYNPHCPANPNTPEQLAQLEAQHTRGGEHPGGHHPDFQGRPDFSQFPERPCGHKKPHCPLVEQ